MLGAEVSIGSKLVAQVKKITDKVKLVQKLIPLGWFPTNGCVSRETGQPAGEAQYCTKLQPL